MYSFHRAANAVGGIVGPISAGFLAYWFGWRVPFLVFVIPTVIFALLALKLREPIRGRWERHATGASEEIVNTEEEAPSFSESWRTVHKVRSLHRIWWSFPFLVTALIGFIALALVVLRAGVRTERARPRHRRSPSPSRSTIVGLVIGARIATRRFVGDVKGLIRFLSMIAIGAAVACWHSSHCRPTFYVAVALNCLISASLADHRARAPHRPSRWRSRHEPERPASPSRRCGSSPACSCCPFIGWVATTGASASACSSCCRSSSSARFILRSVGDVIDDDIKQVWAVGRRPIRGALRPPAGQQHLLLIRGVEAGYGERTVLHGINLELNEGEVVALLGTNGAGKSTLLKAISGVVEADRGAIVLDGRDITHAPPNEIAALGIVQMPGGKGVFGSLTVKENLDLAGWTNRRDADGVKQAIAEALETFPILGERLDSPAANLSGGQQQMLALAMSFIMRPKVLLIDELSLGLAPVIVGQLLPIVQRMAADGVTVVLVEQSVNVALTVAERAYFMERGEIRFSGPTAELLERPDLLRSVFLSAGDDAEHGHVGEQRHRATHRQADVRARRRRCPGAQRQRVVGHLRWDPGRRRCELRDRCRRDRRHHRTRTAPARRRCSTSSPASRRCSPDGSCWPAGTSRRSAPPAGPVPASAARSRTPGCSRS